MNLSSNRRRNSAVVSIANQLIVILFLIIMNGINNNNSENSNNNSNSNVSTVASDSTMDKIAEKNRNMFAQVANMAAADKLDILATTAEKQAEAQKMISERVIRIPNSTMMAAKLNLTSNGALLLSLNDGKQLTNHPLNKDERQTLDKIVNNEELTADEKMQKISNWVSSVALTTTMKSNFDNALAQNQFSGLHR